MFGLVSVSLAVSFASPLLYINLLRRYKTRAAYAVLAGLAVVAVFLSFFMIFGTNFFSRILVCLPLPVAVIGALIFLSTRHKFIPQHAERPDLLRLFRMGLVLVPLLQVAPWPGTMVINTTCNRITRWRAAPIIAAFEDYAARELKYADGIEQLGLDQVPAPACLGLYDVFGGEDTSEYGFYLTRCRSGERLLVVAGTMPEFLQRYDFASQTWATVSFLDGACSYLP